MNQEKLCACGRSKSLPLCDNSHSEEGWSCVTKSEWVEFGFCASFHYQNLARKLASHYQGVTCLEGEDYPVVETLITILDGTDLSFPVKANQYIQAKRRIVITLGTSPHLLQNLFPESHILDLEEKNFLKLFIRVTSLLNEIKGNEKIGEVLSSSSLPQKCLRPTFISHAVKDEHIIMPALDYLRQYFQAEFFTCADSIALGKDWQGEIMKALQEKESFVLLLSEATLRSHFCSFEIGAAYAWQKPIIVISLDGSYPPAFIQHIQAVDIPRIQKQKPWLDPTDILIDALLQGLQYECQLV